MRITELLVERINNLRTNNDHLTRERDNALVEVDRLRAEVERLRGALTGMLSGWRYIRETYGDLAGIGWDRAEQKARNALEVKP
jgi:hypothetical protein